MRGSMTCGELLPERAEVETYETSGSRRISARCPKCERWTRSDWREKEMSEFLIAQNDDPELLEWLANANYRDGVRQHTGLRCAGR